MKRRDLFAALMTFAGAALLGASPAGVAQDKSNRLLWDHWYTVTVAPAVHYAYYNEKVSVSKGRLHVATQLFKQEEGFVNEENLGAYAKDDESVTPLFFNFRSAYRGVETQLDGTFKEGPGGRLALSVKARRGDADLKPVNRTVPSKVFLSSFFPAWIAKKIPSMKERATLNFMVIFEDNLDSQFDQVTGRAWLEKPDAFAERTRTRKVKLFYRGVDSIWWLNADGSYMRMETPSQRSVVELVDETTAKKFFPKAR